MYSYPKISFCIFSYNQEKYIEDALISVFNQDYPNMEIIISDDCSTDSTYDIIQQVIANYQTKHKVILNRNEYNMGLVSHFNYVIRTFVHTDYILLMGGDDVSTTNRARVTMRYFAEHPELGGCTFSYKIINSDGKWIKDVICKNNYFINIKSSQWYSSSSFVIGGLALAFKKSCYDNFGSLGDCQTEDSTMRHRIILTSYFLFSKDICLLYRRHTTNLTSSSNLYKLRTSNISKQYIRDLITAKNRGFIDKTDYKKELNKIIWYKKKRNLLEKSHNTNSIIYKVFIQIHIRLVDAKYYFISKRI